MHSNSLIFLWDKSTLRKIYVAFNWDWAENIQFSCKLLTFIKNVADQRKFASTYENELNVSKKSEFDKMSTLFRKKQNQFVSSITIFESKSIGNAISTWMG